MRWRRAGINVDDHAYDTSSAWPNVPPPSDVLCSVPAPRPIPDREEVPADDG